MSGMTGPLDIVHLTQHWRRLHGAWYRDAVIREPNGCLRAVSILDELL
jgi:hypothetical protein